MFSSKGNKFIGVKKYCWVLIILGKRITNKQLYFGIMNRGGCETLYAEEIIDNNLNFQLRLDI